MQIQKIGNVFYRVDDMDRAIEFYEKTLGLTLKFRDGNQWAAFDVAGVTLALEGQAQRERESGGGATVSLRVSDLDSAALELTRTGVILVRSSKVLTNGER